MPLLHSEPILDETLSTIARILNSSDVPMLVRSILSGSGLLSACLLFSTVLGFAQRQIDSGISSEDNQYKRAADRIDSGEPEKTFASVAFCNPDGRIVLIVVNAGGESRQFQVRLGELAATTSLPACAVATYVWQP